MKTLCSAPAKIILSGEHAVVYGSPALSMAIDFPTTCETTFSSLERHQTPFIEIELSDFGQKHAFPFAIWQQLAISLESRYQLYEKGALSIKAVLKQPVDLVLATLYHYHHHFQIKPGHWQFKISGHNLMGRGLGSSASVITSLLHSLFCQHGQTVNETEILTLAKTVESRQHGQSSGLDPTVIFKGGLIRFQQNQPIVQIESPPFHAWLIDTGNPDASTGQVVNFVKKRFGQGHPIWQDFTKVTEQIHQAWSKQDGQALMEGVTENEILLEEIGVVPERQQQFIKSLQQQGAAAKVCGAGSHLGKNAGILLCMVSEPPYELCHQYGYNCLAIQLNQTGSQCEVVI